ncbi:hypothetical protein BYT27DRAFT_7201265, partial [Phlegmacium glaucopus]
MNGIGGRPGWAWIFILEGLFSIMMSLIGYIAVPSTPHDSKFLTEDQKEWPPLTLEMDRPSMKPVHTFSLKEVFRSLTSPHVILPLTQFFLAGAMVFGLAFPNQTQLLTVGPFATGFFVTIISAFLSDRYKTRGIAAVLTTILAAAGYALDLSAEHRYASYGALYLMVPGVYAPTPVFAAWMAYNSELHYQRATSVALGFMAANSLTWIYPSNQGPKLTKTTIMNLQHPEVRGMPLGKYSVGDKECDDGSLNAWMDLGDRYPDLHIPFG